MNGKKVLWTGNRRLFKIEEESCDFLNAQVFWGHKKNKLNYSLNFNILGFKHEFIIFNPEHLLEFSKRCLLFCYKIILSGSNILFMDVSIDRETESRYKQTVVFFGARSLQHIYCGEWDEGSLIKNTLGSRLYKNLNISCIILNDLNRNFYLFKEILKKLTPLITIDDSNNILDKNLHSFLGNEYSNKSIYLLYNMVSDVLLKCLLYIHCKNLYK